MIDRMSDPRQSFGQKWVSRDRIASPNDVRRHSGGASGLVSGWTIGAALIPLCSSLGFCMMRALRTARVIEPLDEGVWCERMINHQIVITILGGRPHIPPKKKKPDRTMMMHGSSIVNTLIIKLNALPLTRNPHEPVNPCPAHFFFPIAFIHWFRSDCRSLSRRPTHLKDTEDRSDLIRQLDHSGAPHQHPGGKATSSSQPQPPHTILVYARQHSPGSDSSRRHEISSPYFLARDEKVSDWWASPSVGVKYQLSLL